MFKVGDKVVRKVSKDHVGYWGMRAVGKAAPHTVLAVSSNGEYLQLLAGDLTPNWNADYFDLYVEPKTEPVLPAPKFKVGDRVKPKLGTTGCLITRVNTVTEFRYDTDSKMVNVREEKLELSNAPRTVTVDGVVYREVL